MRHRSFGLIPVVLLFSIAATNAAERCSLKVIAQLPVTMEGLRPIVVAKINGVDARFVADSGAAYSMISPATVSEFKLPERRAPRGFSIHGIGGSTTPEIATVQTFTLANYPIHRVNFLVGANEVGAEAVGLIGQDLMRTVDVEFDLANGVLRLIEPEDCAERSLAYWAASKSFSTVDIDAPAGARSQPIGTAFVNGVKIRVDFDTGTPISVLSLSAAKRAGITPSSPGAKPAGTIYGLGRSTVDVWLVPLASFKIGGEDIQNTQVLIGDIRLPETDMLLGDDFFLSHRVYVANDQRKVYFSYNGGPVFDLRDSQRAQPDSANASSAAATASDAAGSVLFADGLGDVSDQPADAAGFMRRGAAYAARKDFEHALADLKRACELAPREPDYDYELGRVQWQADQPDLALETFDAALALKPDHINALFARALLRLQRHADISKELDTLDRLTAPEDNLRLQLGAMYEEIAQYAPAIHQLDLWISFHEEDVQLAAALNARCWSRAEFNQDLDGALRDCNAALRLRPKNPAILDSRGLVRLRRAEFDRSIDDYDAALALLPALPTSLYGRGLAKLRKGLQAEGRTDLAAAHAMQPDIDARFGSFGLKP